MKNKNLRICFTIMLSLALSSMKAQSIQQRFQKDMEQRKKHINAVRSKANEQQVQRQAERTSITVDYKPAPDTKQNETGNTLMPKQPVIPATKPSTNSLRDSKKPIISHK
jgi:hypothetical protein